jgi:hypothetical protein
LLTRSNQEEQYQQSAKPKTCWKNRVEVVVVGRGVKTGPSTTSNPKSKNHLQLESFFPKEEETMEKHNPSSFQVFFPFNNYE